MNKGIINRFLSMLLSISMVVPYLVTGTAIKSMAAEMPVQVIWGPTKPLAVEKIYFAESEYSFRNQPEYTTDVVDMTVTQNQQDSSVYDVEIIFNKKGVKEYDQWAQKAGNWYTANPWFSFWYTNGLSLKGDIKYAHRGHIFTRGESDVWSEKQGFVEYTVSGGYSNLFGEQVYESIGSEQQNAIRSIVSPSDFKQIHNFKFLADRNEVAILTANFQLQKNESFDINKDRIGGVYKSYDANKKFIRTEIIKWREFERKDNNFKIEFAGVKNKDDQVDQSLLNTYLSGHNVTLKYKTQNGVVQEKQLRIGDSASVIYKNYADDAGETFYDAQLYYDGVLKSTGAMITGDAGKSFYINYSPIENVNPLVNDGNKKLYYYFKEVKNENLYKIKDFYEYTTVDSRGRNTPISTLKRKYEIISGNETVDLTGLSFVIILNNPSNGRDIFAAHNVNSVGDFNLKAPSKPSFGSNLGQDSNVFLVDKNGAKTELPNNDPGRPIAVGDKLLFRKAYNGEVTFEVPLNIIDRRGLKQKRDSNINIKSEYKWINADEEAKRNYENALAKVNKILSESLDNINSQTDVESAEREYDDAINALNGKETKFEDLEALIRESEAIKSNVEYTKATEDIRRAFNEELELAKNTIDSRDTGVKVPQVEVDNRISALLGRKNALDGKLKAAKEAAIAELEQKAADKNREIEGNGNLTDEEKAAAKEQVQQALEAAKSAVNGAADDAAVTEKKNEGLTAIGNVNPTGSKKAAAIAELENAAEAKKQEINNNNSLTPDQKEAAKREVEDALNEAKDNVNAAESEAEVDTAKQNGLDAINNAGSGNVTDDLNDERTQAKNEIDAKAQEKKDEINNSNLSPDKKQELIDQVDTIADQAKNNIDTAVTPENIGEVKDNAIRDIDNIKVSVATPSNATPSEATKNAAKDEINRAADEKKQAIDAGKGTAAEKEELKNKVDEIRNNALNGIDNAQSDQAINDIKNDALDKIDKVKLENSGSHHSGGSGSSGGSRGSSSKGGGGPNLNRDYETYKAGMDGDWELIDPLNHKWIFKLRNGNRIVGWANLAYTYQGRTKVYRYHFANDGIMDSGWFKDETGKWYYFAEVHDGFFGRMITGWHNDPSDNNTYYLSLNDGHMLTGWQKLSDNLYYFNDNPQGTTWKYDSNARWIYDVNSKVKPYGSMYRNEVTPDNSVVNADGVKVN